MVEITNPCEEEREISGSNGGDNGGGPDNNNNGGEDTSQSRIAFPEQLIDTLVPLSNRAITVLRSSHFLEQSEIMINPNNPALKEILSFSQLVGPDNAAALNARQAGAIQPGITDEEVELAALKISSAKMVDNIRLLPGLLFTDDQQSKNIIISNQQNLDRLRGLTIQESQGARDPFTVSKLNASNFGCPFLVSAVEEPELQDLPLDAGFGPIAKTQQIELSFYREAIEICAPTVMDSMVGERRRHVEKFAELYVKGIDSFGENLQSITSLSDSQLFNLNIPKFSIISDNSAHLDYSFEAPQPFFREESDYVGLDRQLIADVGVNVSSTFLNDSSVVSSSAGSFSDVTQDELRKKNYYRSYAEKDLRVQDVCEDKQGRVVKFDSKNTDSFTDIDSEYENNFTKHVSVTIINPNYAIQSISNILKEFDMDKYIIEMMSDTQGLRKQDDLRFGSQEVFAVLSDHYYDTDTLQSNVDSYYDHYRQPGEDLSEVKKRINSVLENYNESGFKKDIQQFMWSSYNTNLSMLNLKLPEDHPLRSQLILPDQPGLYGAPEVINDLEWPLGFHSEGREGQWRFDELKRAICSSKIKQYLEPKGFRSYRDILEGKKCFSETIGYKIRKFRLNDGTPEDSPVQEFYLMGHGRNGELNFVDTQVIFEQEYKYEIFSINFVAANSYNQELSGIDLVNPPPFGSGTLAKAFINTMTVPIWSIIEAPFFTKTVSIVDKPPLSPQVSFLPYQGKDDKIRLLLQSNFGSIEQKPIEILPQDGEIVDAMYRAQEIDIASGKIKYSNDSLPTQFQMLRTVNPPESYSDFSAIGSKVVTVPTHVRTAVIDDEIKPNTDYYYIFRAIDERGISNPGFVYKLRMVSYPNGIYMDLKEYEMDKKKDDITIPFREFFQIEPSNLQGTINFSAHDVTDPAFRSSAPNENIPLGNDISNNIWGRKFKLRVISKSSGKKVDLILKFKQQSRILESQDQQLVVSEDENPC